MLYLCCGFWRFELDVLPKLSNRDAIGLGLGLNVLGPWVFGLQYSHV